jgi:hypothetical protein
MAQSNVRFFNFATAGPAKDWYKIMAPPGINRSFALGARATLPPKCHEDLYTRC